MNKPKLTLLSVTIIVLENVKFTNQFHICYSDIYLETSSIFLKKIYNKLAPVYFYSIEKIELFLCLYLANGYRGSEG